MYYEEEVIDGILCWRNDPNGPWVRFKIEALTTAFIAMKGRAETFEKKADTARTGLLEAYRTINEALEAE